MYVLYLAAVEISLFSRLDRWGSIPRARVSFTVSLSAQFIVRNFAEHKCRAQLHRRVTWVPAPNDNLGVALQLTFQSMRGIGAVHEGECSVLSVCASLLCRLLGRCAIVTCPNTSLVQLLV